MYVLYKQGLQDNHWTMVKKLNENLRAKIQTKHGNTRTIKIKDSIRQGGVLSTTLYGILMDEISKALENEETGIELIEGVLKIGSLLWVDDVIVLEEEGKLQPPLDITNETSNIYHIEYGEPKSNSMTIKNNRKKPINKNYNIGPMKLKRTDKYKYLGYLQNEKNNNDDQLKAIQSRTEAAYQKMMALTGNSNFNNLEMETIWLVMKACIMPSITYSGETWEPNAHYYDEANKIADSLIKRVLKTPKGTPREPLYMETGLIDPETIITCNRINMEARIMRNNNETMKKLLMLTNQDSWAITNNEIKRKLKIGDHELKEDKDIVKQTVKKAAYEDFKNKLNESSKEKSKVQYYLQGKKEWTPGKASEYMKKLNRNQASNIFKARTRMLPIKGNQKNEYTDKDGNTHITCRLCKEKDETQKHILEECTTLRKITIPITESMIFDENTENLEETATQIGKILEELERASCQSPADDRQT